MAVFDYTRPKATAERLLARFGQIGAIRRVAVSDDNDTPWDGSDDTVTTTDYACTLVVTEYSLRERESSLIGATDRKVLISTSGVSITPAVSDKLVIEGAAYPIVRIDPLSPGGTVILWAAQVTF